MGVKVGKIELFVGPTGAGAPDDLGKVIIGFIDKARRRLDVSVQELDSVRIAQAIVRAKQRGVTVRMVLEADYLRAERGTADPWRAGGSHEENRAIHQALLRAAIDVKADFNPNIFHHKFAVRDGTAVLTGSANFTETDTTKNLNHVVVIDDERVARQFSQEFTAIMAGEFGPYGPNGPRRPPPADIDVSGIRVRVAFAPDHNPEMEIMKQMLKARRRIEFAMFTFAQSSGIDDVMISLTKHGLPITGALDGTQGNHEWAATRPVKNAGADLYLVRKNNTVRKLHHKLMVLDRQVIIAGSFNYTAPACRLNDENIVVIGDLEATRKSAREKQGRIARYAAAEVRRIVREFGESVDR